ncbi:MAG: hypothetical protein DMG60_02490 [Acidobacteria bacterium]|nr:MAG: hypothetical protein DMG60_02490 [Acidobacteriota bacterium]
MSKWNPPLLLRTVIRRDAHFHHPALARKKTRAQFCKSVPPSISSEQQFLAEALQCDPGDVLLLLTDGFTEIFRWPWRRIRFEANQALLKKLLIVSCLECLRPAEAFARVRSSRR